MARRQPPPAEELPRSPAGLALAVGGAVALAAQALLSLPHPELHSALALVAASSGCW